MLNRCKERRVDGNLMLPITWPMNSDSDQSWSLRNQLSALSLSNQTAAPSSSRSCTWGVGNRKSKTYGDSKSHGRGSRW
ncbi:hypothetical protein Tco_1278138 [Tanacetum coccineum]